MSRRSGSGRRRWDAPPPTSSSSSSESSASLPATAPASTFSGRHDDDTVGSLTAVLARSVLIRKLVLMPKMKAAMLFQPEDHVARERVKAQFGRTLFGGANRRSARLTQLVHFGGIFGAGALLFLGQEVALSWLMSGSLTQHVDVDTAPALKSGIAGSFGGLLYAATATPLANYLRSERLLAHATTPRALARVLGRGMWYTVPRDVGGFGLYFGVYTATRHVLEPFEGPTFERMVSGQYEYVDVVRRLGCASASGAAAVIAAYCWRSPLDTLYKQSLSLRDKQARLLSAQRFRTSKRGMFVLGVGAMTWTAYEASMLAVHRLDRYGRQLEARASVSRSTSTGSKETF